MKRFLKWLALSPYYFLKHLITNNDCVYTNIYVLIGWRILVLFTFTLLFFSSHVPPNLIVYTDITLLISTICICVYGAYISILKKRAKKAKQKADEEEKIKAEIARIKMKREKEGIANCEEGEVYW